MHPAIKSIRSSDHETLPVAKKTYRLGSSPLASAPGFIAWAANGYHFPRDRNTLAKVVADAWNIPLAASHALLSGKVPHETDREKETVTFTF